LDPDVHEALMSQPSDEHEEDTIIETIERGYVLNGELVRPAKVVVAKRVWLCRQMELHKVLGLPG
jgi:molecular chaperone GrpE